MPRKSDKFNLTINFSREKGTYVAKIEGLDRWGNEINSTMWSGSLFSISRFIDKHLDAITDEEGNLV